MVFFIIVLIIVILSQCRFSHDGGFLDDYMGKKNTTAINGIFVILIIFSHYSQYLTFEGVYDYPYLCLQDHLNQMVVATFLFYSGYGMMESIKRKGGEYVLKVPSKFIKLLIRFDIAVLLFWVLGNVFLNLGFDYSRKNMILSFLSWSSIGNSNWYITAILGLYIAFFFSFLLLLAKNNLLTKTLCSIAFLGLAVVFVYIQISVGRPWYCYDTIILMPVGVLYSLLKEKIEAVVMHNNYVYLLTVLLVLGIYILSFFRRFDGIEMYSVWGMSFVAMVLLFTMKVSVYNSLLEWFGEHIFSVYILQRIPMTILDYYGFIDSHKYICLIIVIITTAFIAVVFEFFTDKLFECVDSGVKKIRRKEGQGNGL